MNKKSEIMLTTKAILSTLLFVILNLFCLSGQGVQLQGNGDIEMSAASPELQFKSVDGTITNAALKYFSTGLFLENKQATPIYFQTDDKDRMMIHSSGNVGIGTGTTTPATKLEVRGDLTLQQSTPGLFFKNVAGDMIGEVRSDGTDLEIESENGVIRFQTNNSNRMVIDNVGNVGIGTTDLAAGYKLSVDGKAIAEEVWVELSGTWPDFVFEENYPLKSLPELAEEIKSLGHLPNMPAAAEVEANGFSLGKINRNLLQKVEELTLYAIEADAKNNALANQLANTQQDVEKLKDLIMQLANEKE